MTKLLINKNKTPQQLGISFSRYLIFWAFSILRESISECLYPSTNPALKCNGAVEGTAGSLATVQYSTVRYSTVQYSTVLYNTV